MPCVPDTLILRNYVCCSIAFLAVIKVGSSCACGKVQFMKIDSVSFPSTFHGAHAYAAVLVGKLISLYWL